MDGVRAGRPPGDRVVVCGEVLFDRFPDGGEVLGGAPFNVAWNLEALGADPLLVSRVGNDALGDRILASMTDWGMRTVCLQVDKLHATGTVEVGFDDGEPVFDIAADCAYDYIDEEMIPEIAGRPLLYHGSLVCRGSRSRRALESLIHRCQPSIFLDVNLRSPWWEESRVHHLLETAPEVKMNADELTALARGESRLEARAHNLLSRFAIERLHVTRGEAGALAFTAQGECLEVRPDNPIPVVDMVGAGDAFASVLILGRLNSWPLATSLQRAQEFAAAIVSLQGATISDRSFYQGFREAWRVQ